jgi:hypothetical protein
MALVVLDSKLFARDWKKISLVALVATVFIFFGGGFNSNDHLLSIFVFVVMLSGVFIGVLALWSGIMAVWELISHDSAK